MQTQMAQSLRKRITTNVRSFAEATAESINKYGSFQASNLHCAVSLGADVPYSFVCMGLRLLQLGETHISFAKQVRMQFAPSVSLLPSLATRAATMHSAACLP